MIAIVARRALPLFACVALAAPAAASPEDEVRSTFERFVQVQNAHDAKALAGLLADSPDFLWITRGNVIWGREAALQRFSKLYEGTWQLEPEAGTLKVCGSGPTPRSCMSPSTSAPAGRGSRPKRLASSSTRSS
jgi:hypothetical protein